MSINYIVRGGNRNNNHLRLHFLWLNIFESHFVVLILFILMDELQFSMLNDRVFKVNIFCFSSRLEVTEDILRKHWEYFFKKSALRQSKCMHIFASYIAKLRSYIT
jgi:hypothetical protein